jgi:hypothetical protein
VGIGDPLEAAFSLGGPIPAGTWTLVGDGVIIEPVDVTFEILWRGAAGDEVVATFEHRFEPQEEGFDAVHYEATREAAAVPAEAGDELVLRYRAANATISMAYIPNGGGERYGGRIPFLDLPR